MSGPIDDKEYYEGQKARWNHISYKDCPYPADSPEAESWQDGWLDDERHEIDLREKEQEDVAW